MFVGAGHGFIQLIVFSLRVCAGYFDAGGHAAGKRRKDPRVAAVETIQLPLGNGVGVFAGVTAMDVGATTTNNDDRFGLVRKAVMAFG